MSERNYCLLIDNDEDDREVFGMALAAANLDIALEAFGSGQRALEWIQAASSLPRFIFIDMNMPQMDGPQCLDALRRLPELDSVPVYIYSTAADPRMIDSLKSRGISGFLEKPPNFDGLTRMLSQIIHS
ncbi:response regulator [Flaviaesturariibacter terrae]